jgi:pyruvate, water dikinase
MGKAAEIDTEVNPCLWLNRLQDSGRSQVGEQLFSLSQILQSGCPVTSGFIISDALMQQVWTQVSWADKVLQDFPYLHLNFSPSQATQLQFMAQTLQNGILALPLPKKWAAVWRTGLQPWGGSQILLTPYLWTSQTGIDEGLNLGSMLSLQPQLCNGKVESFWASLKSLWAELFGAGHLSVLQHLGLRPETVHLSVLVQPLPDIQAAGWMQWAPAHLHVQILPDIELSEWQGQQWPEFYTYNRLVQRPSWQRDTLWAETRFQLDWLSETVLQPLLELGFALEKKLPTMPITATWALLKSNSEPQLELLGWAPDLPMPMPQRHQRSPQPSGLLGRGIAAAPGRLVAPVVVVHDFERIPPAALRGAILVTHTLEPSHLAWLREAAGFLCETGGVLSHGAIMAREFGCPAVVGVEGIMAELQTGQWVVLEGGLGEVYAQMHTHTELLAKPPHLETVAQAPRPIQTTAKVMVNLSQADGLEQLQTSDIDGIGLVRGEWLLLDQLYQPGTIYWLLGSRRTQLKRKLWSDLEQMVYALTPLPIFYRAVDLYATDWNRLSATPNAPEKNPAIGLRGALRHLSNSELLDLELEVLKEFVEEGFDNLRLILPFVRSPQEVRHCVQKMQELGIRDRLPLWMMAEVPSVLFALADYQRAGIQGVAIGINDFTQLLLGIDRDHPSFELVWSEQQATVMAALLQLVQHATALKLPIILCGSLDWLSDRCLERLLQAGLMGVSVEMGAVVSARTAIAQAEQQLIHQFSATLKSDSKTP